MRRLSLRCALVLTGLISVSAEAATVNLSWNANTEADLALIPYRFYQAPGTCLVPGAFATVGTAAKAATTATVTVATDGTYCFRMTATDTAGNESLFSNTAEAVVNVNPPLAPANFRVLSVTP